MRRTLGALVLLTLLVGCGDATGHTDGGLKPDPSAAEVSQVALLTGTSAGGEVTTEPTPLPDDAAAEEYAAQFRNDELQAEIVATAKQTVVPEGQQLAAAVVAVGCEVPEKIVGTGSGSDLALHAPLPSPTKQCFAPITTVALVLIPA